MEEATREARAAFTDDDPSPAAAALWGNMLDFIYAVGT